MRPPTARLHPTIPRPRRLKTPTQSKLPSMGTSFASQAGAPGQDNLLVGMGVSTRFGRDWRAYPYYNANLARKDYFSHTVSTGLEWRF